MRVDQAELLTGVANATVTSSRLPALELGQRTAHGY
jgi:hypothetical protein